MGALFSSADNRTPSVENETPSVENKTPSVENETLSVENETPSVDDETPSVDNETPSVDDNKLYNELLTYVMRFEETSRLSDESFVKLYEDENDWKDNHFLKNAAETKKNDGDHDEDDLEVSGGNGDGYNVIIDSYTVDHWKNKLEGDALEQLFLVNDGDDVTPNKSGTSFEAPPLMWFGAPAKSRMIPESSRQYLENLEKTWDEFHGRELDDILECLTLDEVPTQGDTGVKEFLASAIINRELTSLRQKIIDSRQKITAASLELVLGLCHVRMRYKGKGGQRQIVNGPLLVIPVEVKKEKNRICVYPRPDAEVRVNRAVLSAVLNSTGANPEMNEQVHLLTKSMKVESIFPGKSETFFDVAERVGNHHWNTLLKKSSDEAVHDPPADLNSIVITDAWCIFCREKKTSLFEDDAYALLKAAKDGERKMVPGINTMTMGLTSRANDLIFPLSTSNAQKVPENDLIFPLATSHAQKQIAHQLFVSNVPVVCVDGPPGTGKTHSIVNCAATAVSLGRKTLVSSKNERALRSFVEKLPVELEPLCFDFSSCEAGDMTKLLKNIDVVLCYLKESDDQRQQRINAIERDTELLQGKKKDKKDLEASLSKASNKSRKLFQDARVISVLELASLADDTTKPWLCGASNSIQNDAVKILDKSSISNAIQNDTVEVLDMSSILLKLEEHLQADGTRSDMECAPKSVGEGSGAHDNINHNTYDKTWNESCFGQSKPNTLSGRHLRVCQPFQVKYLCKNDLARHGLEDGVYDGFGDILKDFVMKLRKGKDMKELYDKLNNSEQDFLKDVILSPVTRSSQDRFRALTVEIRTLEAKLVVTKTIVDLQKTLTHDNRSKLEELSQLIRRVNCTTFASRKSVDTPRTQRHRDHLTKIVNDVVECLPIVVMSAQQVSTYVPPEHTFGLGILDEASQSDCTAINIMARCEQMLVVGDDQQVSPNRHFLSEERIKELALIAPNIPSRNNLSPEASFFDLIKTAFPSNSILLDEHYRCVPQIMGIFNTVCYNGRLKPLRSQPGESAIEDIYLENTGIPGKGEKKNIPEAKYIADSVFEIVDKAAKLGPSSVKTIGILSLWGEEQYKLIQDLVNERFEPLLSIHGASVVDRHKILYGVPAQCQGDERGTVFLSLVQRPKDGKVFPLTDDSGRKMWNVAMSRPKDKLVVVRSYGRAHLKNKADVRHKFLSGINDPRGNFEGVQRKMDGRDPSKIEDQFASHLQSSGYVVTRNEGPVWTHALHVSVRGEGASSNALLLIENLGESEEQWKKNVNEQISLERAGRACLRVDFVSLALRHKSVLNEALEFLRTDGKMPAPIGLAIGDKNSTRHVSDDSTNSSLTGPTDDASDAKRKALTSYTSEAKRTRVETESTIGRTNVEVESEDSDGSVDAANRKNDTRTLNRRKAPRGAEAQNLGEAVEANGSADSRKNRDHLVRGVKRTKSGDAGVSAKRKA